MAKNIYIPTESYASWQRLLAKPDRQWKEGFSAMTVARSWETAGPSGLPEEVGAALLSGGAPELQNLSLVLAIPEFQVDLPGGSRPSQTDVLAVARGDKGLVAIAVEGKVDETFGPTVREKRADASIGAADRIDFLTRSLGLSNVDDSIRYQLMHRTVSALLIAERFCAKSAVMLVQSFSPSNKWFSDFEAFARLFQVSPNIGQVVPIGVHKGISLYIGWCSGDQRFRERSEIVENAKASYGGELVGPLLTALHFAADKHRDQRRKDHEASPYINHPIEVAELLARVGGVDDLVTLQGAILHDTIEDTNTTGEELETLFGGEVRKVVEEVTDDKTLEKADRKRLQIEHAPRLSKRAKHIKLGDKIANVRSVMETPPATWPVARRKEYLQWTESVIAGVRGCNPPLEHFYDELLARARSVVDAVQD